MKKKEIIEYWHSEAEDAHQVAKDLFEKGDYSYALFLGHLAIEKMLKSIYVKKKGAEVPRTHNLLRIATAAKLKVSEDMVVDLIRITAFGLEARYPDYKRKFKEKCTQDFTSRELAKIDGVFEWLKSIK